jgi:hypothetical protein
MSTTPTTQSPTPKASIRVMRILHAALIVGVCIFAGMSMLVTQLNGGSILDPADVASIGEILVIAAAGLGVICFFIATALYKKRLAVAKNLSKPLQDKLNAYQATLIIYLGICEIAAFFSVIVFFLTGDFKVLAITALMVIAMLMKTPSAKKIVQELELDWKEQQEIV